MWISGKPIVHLVDAVTHLPAERFVQIQSSLEIWKAILHMWSFLFYGPTDSLAVDQESRYESSKFKESGMN